MGIVSDLTEETKSQSKLHDPLVLPSRSASSCNAPWLLVSMYWLCLPKMCKCLSLVFGLPFCDLEALFWLLHQIWNNPSTLQSVPRLFFSGLCVPFSPFRSHICLCLLTGPHHRESQDCLFLLHTFCVVLVWIVTAYIVVRCF